MEYYFAEEKNINRTSGEIIITGFEYKHLAKVLRKKPGDEITLTDGKLNVYACKIEDVNSNAVKCKIEKIQTGLYEPQKKVTLFLSPLKNLSRFEFAVEKAVELGVSKIQPVITEHTIQKNEFSETKKERLRKIIISAMCQSQRCHLPELRESLTLNKMIEQTQNDKIKIVMFEFSKDSGLEETADNGNELDLLIGPEGGFSEKEIELLSGNGWKVKSLGNRKLRAETAAIVSVYKLTGN